eukprot:5177287-Amphidinium_carterae.1
MTVWACAALPAALQRRAGARSPPLVGEGLANSIGHDGCGWDDLHPTIEGLCRSSCDPQSIVIQ